MAMGRCEFEGWDLRPRPASHDGENFLASSPTLRAPPQPVKIYFLLICPIASTIFFNETFFINKNIPEITI